MSDDLWTHEITVSRINEGLYDPPYETWTGVKHIEVTPDGSLDFTCENKHGRRLSAHQAWWRPSFVEENK
jgi:hypothetical protein